MGANARDYAAKVDTAYLEGWGYIWATAGEIWTADKQKALEAKYKSDPKKYADLELGVKYGKKWIGKKVSDCSGLVKKFANLMGVTGIYHGSNSIFNKCCTKVEKITAGMKIPVGAVIFTGNAVGKHDHIGVLTTETCVTEAKGTIAGVVHTPITNKKWTYYGLLKGFDYEGQGSSDKTEPKKKETKKHTTLRKGAKGAEVKELQTLLAKDGSSLAIDGIFGNGTLNAVKGFQKRHGLEVDGIVGPKTWAELMKL